MGNLTSSFFVFVPISIPWNQMLRNRLPEKKINKCDRLKPRESTLFQSSCIRLLELLLCLGFNVVAVLLRVYNNRINYRTENRNKVSKNNKAVSFAKPD